MDVEKQESGVARKRSNALVKRLALRRGDTFVVFKDIKISLAFFGFFFGDEKKNESNNCVEVASSPVDSKLMIFYCFKFYLVSTERSRSVENHASTTIRIHDYSNTRIPPSTDNRKPTTVYQFPLDPRLFDPKLFDYTKNRQQSTELT